MPGSANECNYRDGVAASFEQSCPCFDRVLILVNLQNATGACHQELCRIYPSPCGVQVKKIRPTPTVAPTAMVRKEPGA